SNRSFLQKKNTLTNLNVYTNNFRQSHPDFIQLSTTLSDNRERPKSLRDEIVSCELLNIRSHYNSGIQLLRVIAVISPMVGLLGTVVGIIDAFKEISETTAPVTPALIADGLWTAMLTTAFGIIIALPSLFFAFILARMSEKRIRWFQSHLNRESLRLSGVRL
ncbi:MAG: MotA/TolQ/ExbB proton channel family protein, partial [Rickettsiales bacterium]|nr:MotA/TolQ/ExbB proton channel family protein [Rickettsiales bacterium]